MRNCALGPNVNKRHLFSDNAEIGRLDFSSKDLAPIGFGSATGELSKRLRGRSITASLDLPRQPEVAPRVLLFQLGRSALMASGDRHEARDLARNSGGNARHWLIAEIGCRNLHDVPNDRGNNAGGSGLRPRLLEEGSDRFVAIIGRGRLNDCCRRL
ncbi:hypothetical protein Nepgr_002170 [Nepenthes gracilis]|uniref:Uncharacterized protein n=1 Tax=Nepenthes gracilis TaxID=150966 RepID=A0AAD3P6E3_NEPGR|nr:hypothetical protein Nepgr_002170 [Nepenthes gracilis]